MIFVLRGVYGFTPEHILNAAKTIFYVKVKSENDRQYVYQTVYNVKRKFQLKYPDSTKYVGFKIDGREQRKEKR